MKEDLFHLLLLVNRYFHVIAATFIVGGTLFYELIFPVAIDELKDEQKLWVFARARWAFRWIVWCCVTVLILSGVVSSFRNWFAYTGLESRLLEVAPTTAPEHFHLVGPGNWWLAHVIVGSAGLCLAFGLVTGRTPPRYPVKWMRINLLILLIAIFLASAARHVRLRYVESHLPAPNVPNTID
ncbi:MAG TPA: hypothetical protein VHD56_02400 [Tepidisphaeraceae bacterium]|nr:hypothetical protein [Tepidisphaeraceae bacterium]